MAKVTLEGTMMAPSLTVNDLKRSVPFYTEGLGFSVKEQHEVEGQVRFVMLQGGTAQLGLGQDDFAKGKDRVKGTGMRLWVTTDQDVKALAAQAKAAGITLDDEVHAMPWGPLGFALTDPDGFKLTISNDR
jgi:lactoylglutathione lyase